jgi:hypothetical protein
MSKLPACLGQRGLVSIATRAILTWFSYFLLFVSHYHLVQYFSYSLTLFALKALQALRSSIASHHHPLIFPLLIRSHSFPLIPSSNNVFQAILCVGQGFSREEEGALHCSTFDAVLQFSARHCRRSGLRRALRSSRLSLVWRLPLLLLASNLS